MKLLVFTADQRRHHALVRKLTPLGEVHVVGEVLPPRAALGPAKTEYVKRMDAAEREVFPEPAGLLDIKGAYLALACNLGAASHLAQLEVDVESYDAIVVYGSSWLKPPLVDRLIAKKAINLHAGLAPFYRGTACNAWAVYDGNPGLVGCTIHFLAHGIDNGMIITSTGVEAVPHDPWLRGMRAIEAGQERLVEVLGYDKPIVGYPQGNHVIRCSRAADFTEDVCREFLDRHVGHRWSGHLDYIRQASA